ncbi:MAG: hypothetical protein AAFX10_04300 [Pseudomonadota bacterium]
MSFEPERALQWWDDVDDLVGALALKSERIRRWILVALATLVFALLIAAGVVMAVLEPPLGLATSVLLLVVLMYRTVTGQHTLEINA